MDIMNVYHAGWLLQHYEEVIIEMVTYTQKEKDFLNELMNEYEDDDDDDDYAE